MTLPARSILALVLVGTAVAFTQTTPAAANEPTRRSEQAALEQRIDADQPIANGRAVLQTGHVDIGPRYVGDKWSLLIHDDTTLGRAGGRSVWRSPERTVLRVSDAAAIPVPDDPAYEFLGVEPGKPAYVIPQTQDPEVVWVGWNTQDPSVIRRIDRGITLELEGVEGPGRLVVYLQSGSFDIPKELWNSDGGSNAIWVDGNTHTHANWVFTEPGIYLVRAGASATLRDGSKVSGAANLRFAVGSSVDVGQAFAAEWSQVPGSGESGSPSGSSEGGDSAAPAALVVAALILAGIGAGVAWRSRRIKDSAARDRLEGPEGGR